MIVFLLFHFFSHVVIRCSSDCPLGFTPNHPLPQIFTESHLQITTFNVYWLFNRTNNMIPWRNSYECMDHARRISDVMDGIDSHIFNLCEVQDCEIVDFVRSNLRHRGKEYNTFVIQSMDSGTGQNVALLSKYQPIEALVRTENRCYYPLEYSDCGYNSSNLHSTGVSKHYFSLFNLNETRKLLLVGIHLKAFPNDSYCCAKREAQAKVLINQVKSYQRNYSDLLVVVLGDFNDFDGNMNGERDRANDLPLSQVLKRMKSELGLRNVFSSIKKDDRYSFFWDDQHPWSLLDHMLVSDDLYEVLISLKVETQLYPNGNHNYSDHWPVTAKFDLTKLEHQHHKYINDFNLFSVIIFVVIFCLMLFLVCLVCFVVGLVLLERRRLKSKKKRRNMDEYANIVEEEELEELK